MVGDHTVGEVVAKIIDRKPHVVAFGDIALDRTLLCRKSPPSRGHASHAGEEIFDIDPNGDDYGVVGNVNNTCLLALSFGADTFLLTAVGPDAEGLLVREYLTTAGVPHQLIKLDRMQTITRLRFFIFNETRGKFELRFRMDK